MIEIWLIKDVNGKYLAGRHNRWVDEPRQASMYFTSPPAKALLTRVRNSYDISSHEPISVVKFIGKEEGDF